MGTACGRARSALGRGAFSRRLSAGSRLAAPGRQAHGWGTSRRLCFEEELVISLAALLYSL